MVSAVNTHNCLVNSVAGSGKTTTVLGIAAANPHKNILLLTYNARLKTESRIRTQAAGLHNLEVHSYHAMGVKYYSDACSTDIGSAVYCDLPTRAPMPRYHFLIIDEAQDVTGLLYGFVAKVMRDHQSAHSGSLIPTLVVLGDENQTIFSFMGADSRYLTLADCLYHECSGSSRPWTRLRLSITYRNTSNIVRFVNSVMLGRENMVAVKPAGAPVKYFVGDNYKAARALGQWLNKEIAAGRIHPGEVFVLVGSLKSVTSNSPVKVLENILAEASNFSYKPPDNRSDLDPDAGRGQIIFSTFHQVKGVERPVVILFGLNKAYFEHVAKSADPLVCPPPHYVAVTRAQRQLVIVAEKSKGDVAPYLNRLAVDELAQSPNPAVEIIKMEGYDRPDAAVDGESITADAPKDKAKNLVAHDLFKHVPEAVLDAALQNVSRALVQPAHVSAIKLPATTVSAVSGHVIHVADLNGLAIPALLEARCGKGQGRCSMFEALEAAHAAHVSRQESMHKEVLKRFKQLRQPAAMQTVSHFLELAAVYQAGAGLARGFVSQLMQLTKFDWLSESVAEQCMDRLEQAVGSAHLPGAQFEYLLDHVFEWRDKNVHLQGLLDVVTSTTVWELKCVRKLDDSHFLQLAIYAWLWQRTQEHRRGERDFNLFNVLTGEIWQIDTNPEKLDAMMQVLLQFHFRESATISDEEFLANAKKMAAPGASWAPSPEITSALSPDRRHQLSFSPTREVMLSASQSIGSASASSTPARSASNAAAGAGAGSSSAVRSTSAAASSSSSIAGASAGGGGSVEGSGDMNQTADAALDLQRPAKIARRSATVLQDGGDEG